MKVLLILITLLLVIVAGSIGGFVAMRPDDAQFVVNYINMSDSDRMVQRNAQDRIRSVPGLSQAEFDKLYVNEDIKKRFDGAKSPESVQQLMVEALKASAASVEEKAREGQASVERQKMTVGEYADFRKNLEARDATLKTERDAFDRERKEWEALKLNTTLKQFVTDIDKAENKKYDGVASRFKLMPLMHQAYVYGAVTKNLARDALFAALSDEQKSALTNELTRVKSMDNGTMMPGTTTASK